MSLDHAEPAGRAKIEMSAPSKSSPAAGDVDNILHMGSRRPNTDPQEPVERATSGAYLKPRPRPIEPPRRTGEPPHDSHTAERMKAGDLSGRLDQNPDDLSLIDLLTEDFETHDRDLTQPGFWALAVHRFGNWRMNVKPRPARAPLSAAYNGLYHGINWLWGIDLRYSTRVGRRVRLWHHGGMVLSARSIGNDVHIRQNTTFGVARRGADVNDKPVIRRRRGRRGRRGGARAHHNSSKHRRRCKRRRGTGYPGQLHRGGRAGATRRAGRRFGVGRPILE